MTNEKEHDGFYYLDDLSNEALLERMNQARQRIIDATDELVACLGRIHKEDPVG